MIPPLTDPHVELRLRYGVRVLVFETHVHTGFPDGTRSVFYPPACDAQFKKCAQEFGYTDPHQYGIEHDVTHSWLADVLGRPYSEVVWADAHSYRPAFKQQAYDDEEHMANRMLLYLNTGKVDDDFGVLQSTFGMNLPGVGMKLWHLLRVRIII